MENPAIGKLDGTFSKGVLAALPHPHKVEGMNLTEATGQFGDLKIGAFNRNYFFGPFEKINHCFENNLMEFLFNIAVLHTYFTRI